MLLVTEKDIYNYKRANSSEDITHIYVCVQKLIEFKGEIENSAIIIGDFYPTLNGRPIGQKISSAVEDEQNVMADLEYSTK